MKRKLFSAILFGALLTASTSGLTSCKDYDDDISNLQSQIDKLATADQLSAKVSEMQAAISAAQSAAEAKAANAQTVADAAKAAAADAAAAASKAQSTADGATQAAKDAAAAAAAADEVAKAAKAAVDKLAAEGHATKAELEEAAKAAQAYVDSVKKAIEETHAADKAAIEKAINDGLDAVKAEIAKTNEELAALSKRLDACEEKLAAIEAGEGQEEALKAIQEEVEAVAEVLEDIIGEYTSMVTEVSLFKSTALDKVWKKPFALDFVYVAQEKTTTFPAEEGVADAQIEFSEKNKNVTTTDSLVIRVSPTNAILNPANISLINSQGKELSEFVEVESVKPYTELLTKSAEGNGLWNVVFKVKEGIDREKFAEAVTYNKKNVLFAVAVNNTESNDVRRVISTYDVTATPSTYEPARSDFQVTDRDGAWTDVAELHNRFFYKNSNSGGYGASSIGENAANEGRKEIDVPEYRWKKYEPQIAGSKSYELDGNYSNYPGDARTGKKIIEVAVGQPIELSVATYLNGNEPAYENDGYTSVTTGDNAGYQIKGFYVTLDKDFAVESNPSEWNAWKKYEYTNVGIPGTDTKAKLFYGNTGSISIDDEDALEDVIGFRVYAVNLDGTLVDPDGRAFYVRVATDKVASPLTIDDLEATLNYDSKTNVLYWKGVGQTNFCSAKVELSDAVKAIAGEVDQTKTVFEIVKNPTVWGNNSIVPEYGENKDYYITLESSKGNDVLDCAKITIRDPQKFLDDAQYTAKATLKKKNGTSLCDVTVNFTKVMPTEAPALAWAQGWNSAEQIIANSKGEYKVDNSTPEPIEFKKIMNYLAWGNHTKFAELTDDYEGRYTLTFEGVKDGENHVRDNAPKAISPNYTLTDLDGWAVDGAAHAVKYSYNFGNISLQKDYNGNNYVVKPWSKDGAEKLSMNFNSWIDFEQIAWAKDAQPTVYWGTGEPKEVDFYPMTEGYTTKDKETSLNYYFLPGTYAGAKYFKFTTGAALPTTGMLVYRLHPTYKKWMLYDLAAVKKGIRDWTASKWSGYESVSDEKLGWVIKSATGENKYYHMPESGLNADDPTKPITENQFVEIKDKVEFVADTHWVKKDKNGKEVYETFRYVLNPGEATAPAEGKDGNYAVAFQGLYYYAKYDAASKTYKIVHKTSGNILDLQNDVDYVRANGAQVADGTEKYLVYKLEKGEYKPGGERETSIVEAWNTVMSKYTDEEGASIFGTSAKKKDFMKDLYGNGDDKYIKTLTVEAASSDPYTAAFNTDKTKIILTPKTGVANPSASKGTLTFKATDCFGKRFKTWTLEYVIKVN